MSGKCYRASANWRSHFIDDNKQSAIVRVLSRYHRCPQLCDSINGKRVNHSPCNAFPSRLQNDGVEVNTIMNLRKTVYHRAQSGQAIVLIALAMIGLLAFMVLAIDGSKYFDQRRITQNAADASALAGLYSFRHDSPHTDNVVLGKIQGSAGSNCLPNPSTNISAYWVDGNGDYVGDANNGGSCTNGSIVGSGNVEPPNSCAKIPNDSVHSGPSAV